MRRWFNCFGINRYSALGTPPPLRGQNSWLHLVPARAQCEICRHFYMRQVNGLALVDYQPYINDVQGVNAPPLRVRIRQP